MSEDREGDGVIDLVERRVEARVEARVDLSTADVAALMAKMKRDGTLTPLTREEFDSVYRDFSHDYLLDMAWRSHQRAVKLRRRLRGQPTSRTDAEGPDHTTALDMIRSASWDSAMEFLYAFERRVRAHERRSNQVPKEGS